jgi:hypothetical protein
MNSHLKAAIAAERQRDMERAAGCCRRIAEHGRALLGRLRQRPPGFGAGHPPVRSSVCCSAG